MFQYLLSGCSNTVFSNNFSLSSNQVNVKRCWEAIDGQWQIKSGRSSLMLDFHGRQEVGGDKFLVTPSMASIMRCKMSS